MRFKIYLSLINLPQVNTKSSVKTYTASHFVSGLDRELGDTQCDIAGVLKFVVKKKKRNGLIVCKKYDLSFNQTQRPRLFSNCKTSFSSTVVFYLTSPTVLPSSTGQSTMSY